VLIAGHRVIDEAEPTAALGRDRTGTFLEARPS